MLFTKSHDLLGPNGFYFLSSCLRSSEGSVRRVRATSCDIIVLLNSSIAFKGSADGASQFHLPVHRSYNLRLLPSEPRISCFSYCLLCSLWTPTSTRRWSKFPIFSVEAKTLRSVGQASLASPRICTTIETYALAFFTAQRNGGARWRRIWRFSA